MTMTPHHAWKACRCPLSFGFTPPGAQVILTGGGKRRFPHDLIFQQGPRQHLRLFPKLGVISRREIAQRGSGKKHQKR